jgi:hypothetical protein
MTNKKKRDIRAVVLLAAFLASVFCVNAAIAGKDSNNTEQRLREQQANFLRIQQAQQSGNSNSNPNNP